MVKSKLPSTVKKEAFEYSSYVMAIIEYKGTLSGGTVCHEKIVHDFHPINYHNCYALFRDLKLFDLMGIVGRSNSIRVNVIRASIKLIKEGVEIASRMIDTQGQSSPTIWIDDDVKIHELSEFESIISSRESLSNELNMLRRKDEEYVHHFKYITSQSHLENMKKGYLVSSGVNGHTPKLDVERYNRRVSDLKTHIFTDDDRKRLSELESITGDPFF